MNEIIRRLKRAYPNSECSLSYRNPFELLVATVLSAQCTDERVNRVTPVLFKTFPNPSAMSQAKMSEIEAIIRSTGFFRSKARSIHESALKIVEKHAGEVPRTMEELTALRGVGRKTANVVLGNAYGIPGMVVDTHVGRLSRRLGFTKEKDPEKIERNLMKIVPRHEWTLFSHLLISHGRAICSARSRPLCEKCPLSHHCPRIGVSVMRGLPHVSKHAKRKT